MKKAVTLAEVLITLGIIGIVAAMTIPTLISVNNQRAWDTAANVFERKLGESLSVMNTQNALGGWPTTEQFVNELQKHMKINKVCSTPTDCFENEITSGSEDEIIDITKITQAKNLYSTADPDWGTNVMGLQFANGVSALLAYNPRCKNDQFSNQNVKISGSVENNGKKGTVGLSTNCISILYDVNGYGKPNKFTTGTEKADLRGVNVSLKTNTCSGTEIGGKCVADFGLDYSPVDCSNSSSPDYKYCGPTPSGYTDDYWAGAKKKCADEGMTLPDPAALQSFHNTHRGQEGVPTTGWFWPSSEDSRYPQSSAWIVLFSNGGEGYNNKNNQYRVLCLE